MRTVDRGVYNSIDSFAILNIGIVMILIFKLKYFIVLIE